MDSTRQLKVSRLIQKELGNIFQQESKTLFEGVFITVTLVRVTSDLSIARIYLSLFLTKDKEATLKLVKQHTKPIRGKLATMIKNQVRIIPQLEFFIDDSYDYAANIDNLLKK